MPVEVSAPVQRERDALTRQTTEANIRLEQLKKAYAESPEMRIERDNAELQRLQNDLHRANRVISGSAAARAEEEVLAARIRTAETQVAAARLDVELGHSPAAAVETTIGDQIPRRDHADAVASLVEAGVRPGMVETFLRTGHGDDPGGRSAEEAAAAEWERRLLADPEKRAKFLAKDPTVMREFAYFGMYRADPRREP